MEKPKYQHKCEECIFLGRYDDPESGDVHDLYVCRPLPRIRPRFVVVRSDDPEQTYGLSWSVKFVPGNSSPAEAYRRARAQGLL